MKIDTYQSTINPEKFLTVSAGADIKTLSLDDADYASVRPFKQGRDVNFGDNLLGFDSNAAIVAIQQSGFYLHKFIIEMS